MKTPGAVALPPVVVSAMVTAPREWVGATAATRVSDSTANVAGTPPKVTPVVVDRPVPVMSTRVPPAGRPVRG